MARQTNFISKPEPAVLELQFNLPAGTRYLDINQVLCLVNRKMFRQGMQVPVASLEVQFKPLPAQNYATGSVTISKLPTTWVLANSWVKSYQGYKKMIDESLEEAESIRPAYGDFKIYADSEHHALGYDLNIMPTSIPNRGMWEASKVIIPDTTAGATGGINNYEVIATGANYPGPGASLLNAVSMIEGYAASRRLPDVVDPNVPDDAFDTSGVAPENWMTAIFNEGTRQDEQVIQDAQTENNSAPYPFENGPIDNFPGTYWTDTMYPNGANQTPGLQFHDELLITTSTIGGSDTAIGGVFPCGLIKFETTIENGDATLILRLIPGDHRGYLQEPMQEMNTR